MLLSRLVFIMKKFRHVLFVFSLVVLTLHASADTLKKLRVGAVLSLTGMASAHGTAIKDGLEFAKLNLEKQGWNVDIIYDDDASEAKRTVSSYQRQASDGVKLFVGPTWDVLASAVHSLVIRTKSLSLQPCNSSDFREGKRDRYYFFLSPPSSSQSILNEFVAQFKGKRVAILNNMSPWGELWKRLFTAAIEKSGAVLVRTDMIQFSENTVAIPTLMTRYKQEGIEVILSTTTKESNALIVSALGKLRSRMVLLSPDLSDSVSEKLIPEVNGFVDGYTITPIVSQEFAVQFRKQNGYLPKKYTDSGYDTLMALAKAVENVGQDTEQIKEFLETKLDMEGAAGRIKLDEKHDIEGRGYEIRKLVRRES